MTWDETLIAICTLALAVYAVWSLSRRETTRSRVWYAVALAVGAGLGLAAYAWPEGVILGLGAAGVCADVARAVRQRLLPWLRSRDGGER